MNPPRPAAWRLWLVLAATGCLFGVLLGSLYASPGPRLLCWLIAALNLALVRFWVGEARRPASRPGASRRTAAEANAAALAGQTSSAATARRWWTDSPTREEIHVRR